MARILMPKSKINVFSPLIFLAGPIRDAPPWHDDAICNILAEDFTMTIATPTRRINYQYAPLVAQGHEQFYRQRAWERHYLKAAALGDHGGAIMFWLPRHATHHCEKSYGAMSRVEYGEWLVWRRFEPVRMVLGTDMEFSEIDTMLDDLKEYAPDLPVYRTLEETCTAALRIARR